jgi:hypothetical protein
MKEKPFFWLGLALIGPIFAGISMGYVTGWVETASVILMVVFWIASGPFLLIARKKAVGKSSLLAGAILSLFVIWLCITFFTAWLLYELRDFTWDL